MNNDQIDASQKLAGGNVDKVAPAAAHGGAGEHHVPTHSVPGTGRRVAIAAVVVVVALVAIFIFGLLSRHRVALSLAQEAQAASEAPPTVDVALVHRAPLRKILTLPGEARAFNETTIYARTSGYINKWLVDIGDHVKQGQILAIIDTPELDDQLNAAKARVLQAKSEAALAESMAKFAKVTFDRFQSATPDGVVSEQERDQKKSEFDTCTAKVDAAKAQVAVDEAEVHSLQTLVGFKNVIAPFAGTITQRHIDIGDLVTAGSTSSTTPLFTITKSDQLRVLVDVPQAAVPVIKPGMSAVVTADEFAGRTFTGTVDRMADAVDRTSRTMRVEVLVANSDFLLKPGDYLGVSFQTDRLSPPLEIPASALIMKSEGAETAVVNADGVVKFHPIKIEQDMGSYIEVASGLKDGQRVAMNVSGDVVDGDHVSVHDESADGAAKLTVRSAMAPMPRVSPATRPTALLPTASVKFN